MLSIIVNGKQLTIERGTTIQLECNNNVFSTDGVDGDVAYSFDVPAAPNDLIFNSARFVYVERKKKYDCEILVGGYPIGIGNLYITKATRSTYSCEMVIHAFPDGWSDRKLCDNDFEEDIVISSQYTTHQAGWISFLQNSLSQDSKVKFPLFIDEEYYSDNDDFGFFDGKKNPPIGVLDNFERPTKFVNRLAFTDDHVVSSKQSFRNPNQATSVVDGPWNLFNEEKELTDETIERNQVSFAPALRLKWLLENVISNAGYKLKGNFSNSDELSTMFYQSMRSMDGTVYSEYTLHDSYFAGELCEDYSSLSLVSGRDRIPILSKEDPYGLFEAAAHTYKIVQEGVYHFTLKAKFYATPQQLYAGTQAVGCCMLNIRDVDTSLPSSISCTVDTTTDKWVATSGYKTLLAMVAGQYYHGYDFEITYIGETAQEWQDDGGGPCEVTFDFTVQTLASDIGKSLCFEFDFCEQTISTDHTTATIGSWGPMRCTTELEVKIDNFADYSMNIFARKLHFADHVPDMSNSELLNTIKLLYGLTFMVDSSAKTIEMSFINDVLNAGAIDLTENVFNEETEISTGDTKSMTFELSPNKAPSYSEENRMEDVEFMSQMEAARNNIGKVVLVKHLNEIYKSEQQETDTIVGWTNTWERNGGNDTKLEYDCKESDSEESIKPDCEIPSVEFIHCAPTNAMTHIAEENSSTTREITDADRNNTATVHFPDIECKCVSYLNNEDNKTETDTAFPLILLRQIADEQLPSFTDHKVVNGIHNYIKRYWANDLYYNHFSPVCYNNNNNRVTGKDLTAVGTHSIGEAYVSKWLKLIGNHETVTYKFRFNVHQLLEVMKLFRPQDTEPKNQIRWIIVENVKTLPISMEFEIVEGKDTIIAELECAKPMD